MIRNRRRRSTRHAHQATETSQITSVTRESRIPDYLHRRYVSIGVDGRRGIEERHERGEEHRVIEQSVDPRQLVGQLQLAAMRFSMLTCVYAVCLHLPCGKLSGENSPALPLP